MSEAELNAAAKALWDAAPMRQGLMEWEQLGDVTQSVWRERVLAQHFGDLA